MYIEYWCLLILGGSHKLPIKQAEWENYAGKEQAHVKCKTCTNLIRGKD